MEREPDNEASAEIIATADSPASPNGSGALVDEGPGLAANPGVMIAAALVGGFLLARLVRRRVR
jgi:hypothetical protein